MTAAVWIGIVFLVGVVFSVGVGVRDLLKRHRGRILQPLVLLKFFCLLSILVGFVGFAGRMILSTGLGAKLPGYVEFPVEPDQTTFTDSKGNIFVPLVELGRMQVYSPDRAFRYAWSFPTYGGEARVDLVDDSTVSIFTLKHRSLADYDIRGNVRALSYGAPLGSLSDFRLHADFSPKITSSYLLLACTSIVGAWITGLGGILLLLGLEKFERRRKQRIPVADKMPSGLASATPS